MLFLFHNIYFRSIENFIFLMERVFHIASAFYDMRIKRNLSHPVLKRQTLCKEGIINEEANPLVNLKKHLSTKFFLFSFCSAANSSFFLYSVTLNLYYL